KHFRNTVDLLHRRLLDECLSDEAFRHRRVQLFEDFLDLLHARFGVVEFDVELLPGKFDGVQRIRGHHVFNRRCLVHLPPPCPCGVCPTAGSNTPSPMGSLREQPPPSRLLPTPSASGGKSRRSTSPAFGGGGRPPYPVQPRACAG